VATTKSGKDVLYDPYQISMDHVRNYSERLKCRRHVLGEEFVF
jgi:hypothetical protein